MARTADVAGFLDDLDRRIVDRRKNTSPLYQLILDGKATAGLLQGFVLQRVPVKAVWMRHLLSIASRIEDPALRRPFVENAYEEETGALTGSKRHFDLFLDFGRAVGVAEERFAVEPQLPETDALVAHNLRVCNDTSVHFTVGVAAVVLLMEAQPPIVAPGGDSMLAVMRDQYRLPPEGYEFFVHHASATAGADAPSELEDEHADAARELLARFCDTAELRQQATEALVTSIELRHRHFDAILDAYYDPADAPYVHGG